MSNLRKNRGKKQKLFAGDNFVVPDPNKFVGRAEQKLFDAVMVFGFDFRGKTVLDIGSSTGGFTELALARGAQRVIAIEKGTNQMKAPLRFDSRIDLREKTDIFDVDLRRLTKRTPAGGSNSLRERDGDEGNTGVGIDVVLADVSFVSLKKVLRRVKPQLGAGVDWLVMLKPQFEARPDQLTRGVVKNEKIRRQIIRNFEQWLKGNGFLIIKKRDNMLAGKNGNLERFYWLRNGA